MDAFASLFSDTKVVTATIREKQADGTVRSAKLNHGPTDMSEQAFADAAMKGSTFSERAGTAEVSRTRSRKDVTGAAARSAVLAMLGVNKGDAVPAATRNRSANRTRTAEPSLNNGAPTDDAVPPQG